MAGQWADRQQPAPGLADQPGQPAVDPPPAGVARAADRPGPPPGCTGQSRAGPGLRCTDQPAAALIVTGAVIAVSGGLGAAAAQQGAVAVAAAQPAVVALVVAWGPLAVADNLVADWESSRGKSKVADYNYYLAAEPRSRVAAAAY